MHDVAILVAAEDCSAPDATQEPPTAPKGHVVVTCANGVKVTVRKGTLCWRLGEEPKLSADRLLRVQEGRDRVVRPAAQPDSVTRSESLAVNQWAVFRGDAGTVVGRVLTLRYLSGATEKRRQYQSESALTTSPNLGCVCSWFEVSEEGRLTFLPADHSVRPLTSYLFTCPPPTINGCKMEFGGLVLRTILSS